MVERVQPAIVRPWVRGWVKADLCGRGRVYFTDERKGSVEVGVPGDRTSRKKRGGNEGCPRVHQRLSRHRSGIRHAYSWVLRTWNPLADAAPEDANLTCWRPGNMNNPTPRNESHGDVAQKVVLTELKRFAARRGAAREAENAPVLLRAAAGSL